MLDWKIEMEQRALYYEKMLEMLSKQNGKEVQP